MKERRGHRREEEEEEEELSGRDENGEMALVKVDGQVRAGTRPCALFGVTTVIPGTRLDTMARLKNEAHISSLAATSSLRRAWFADCAERQGSPPS